MNQYAPPELVSFARRIAALEKDKVAAKTPALALSSIEDGAIDEYDGDGVLSSQIGKQFDGTHAAVSLAGPPPPKPTAPQVTIGSRSLTVRWDGRFDGDSISPMDLKQVEAVITTDPTLAGGRIKTTITGELGSEAVISPLPEVPHYVWLVARSHSGKASVGSAVIQATPAEVVAPGTIITGAIIQTDYAPDEGIKLNESGLVAHPDLIGATVRLSSSIRNGYAGLAFEGTTDTIGIYSTGSVLRFESDSINPDSGYMAVSTTGITIDGGDVDIHSRVAIRDNLVVNSIRDGAEVFAAFSDEGTPAGLVRSMAMYNATTTIASNLYVTSNGFVRRSTSLEAAKINIDRQWADTADLDAIKRLAPATYYDKGNTERYAELTGGAEVGDAEYPTRQLGLIAEDVAALGLQELNTYDGYGNINGVAYERGWLTLLPWEHEQDKRIADLEATVAKLMERVTDLEGGT